MVEVTQMNAAEAAAAAQRLLQDRFLQEALAEMLQMATEVAIYGATEDQRRDARYQALAITNLQQNLITTAESWREAAELLQRARAHE